jgi:beta-lactamase class A
MRSFRPRTGLLTVPLISSALLLTACSSGAAPSPGRAASPRSPAPTASAPAETKADSQALASLETKFHAHLGLYAIDTGTGQTVTYQPGLRFAFCSTIKALAAGELLKRATNQQLSHVITYKESDLVEYSPVTGQHVSTGMTLIAVMTAALEYSDNTAANLMFDQLGGPAKLQAALRALGDQTTDVDRNEPTLNSAVPGQAQDTSTAQAMATDLRTFVLGRTLTPTRRAMITGWLRANTTGGPYIRAAVPPGWTVGDKTGNGYYGTRNDIAVVWPPHRAPIVIAVLTSRYSKNATSEDPLIADATKIALAALS